MLHFISMLKLYLFLSLYYMNYNILQVNILQLIVSFLDLIILAIITLIFEVPIPFIHLDELKS